MFVFWSICIFVAIAYVKSSAVEEYFVDQGDSLSITCPALRDRNSDGPSTINWVHIGRKDPPSDRITFQSDGSMILHDVNRNDSGLYECYVNDANNENETKSKIRIQVRTPPPALLNVSVHPSTILALILWEVKDNGGYPILDFTAQYKLANSDEEWKAITPNHMSPNTRQIDVYKLEPNTTYAFRIWATNHLGRGEATEVESKTLKIYEESELVKHFLAGAETFDTRIWIAAVGIVMGTLTLLGLGTCYLLYWECRKPSVGVVKKCTPTSTSSSNSSKRTRKALLQQMFLTIMNGNVERSDEQEIIELVPNIILNPGFEDNNTHPYLLRQHYTTEHIPADENSNNETTIRLNNNTVVQPRHV